MTDLKKDEKVVYKNNDVSDFVRMDVKRGFTEIENIWRTIEDLDAFICGGYVRYMVSGRRDPFPAGDVDVYSYDEDTFNVVLSRFKENGCRRVKHENNMSVTFSRPVEGMYAFSPVIQLIKPQIEARIVSKGSMKDILENFDFSVVRCGLLTPRVALVDGNFEEDEMKGRLRLKNIHCPISSTLRCLKYSRKGYWMTPVETLKLFLDWDERDENYREKLVDFINKANDGEGLTEKEVNELEEMMRID